MAECWSPVSPEFPREGPTQQFRDQLVAQQANVAEHLGCRSCVARRRNWVCSSALPVRLLVLPSAWLIGTKAKMVKQTRLPESESRLIAASAHSETSGDRNSQS